MQLSAYPTQHTEAKPQFGSVRIKNTGSGLADSFAETPADSLFLGEHETPLLQRPEFDVTDLYEKEQRLLQEFQTSKPNNPPLSAEAYIDALNNILKVTQAIRQQIASGFKKLDKAELKQISAEITDLDVRRSLRNYGLALPKPLSERLQQATRTMKKWGAEPIQTVQRLWDPWLPMPFGNTFSKVIAITYALCILPIKLPIMATAGFFWGFLEA